MYQNIDNALYFIKNKCPMVVWFKEVYGEKMLQTLIASGKIKETKGRLYLNETSKQYHSSGRNSCSLPYSGVDRMAAIDVIVVVPVFSHDSLCGLSRIGGCRFVRENYCVLFNTNLAKGYSYTYPYKCKECLNEAKQNRTAKYKERAYQGERLQALKSLSRQPVSQICRRTK